jgi:hypothetical protein
MPGMTPLARYLFRKLLPRSDRGGLACLDILEAQFGHARSRRERACVAADGSPIPWYTYPAIEFLRQLDFSGQSVFEYGCGNSTLFWGQRARRVVSVENDPDWHVRVKAQIGVLPIDLRLVIEREAYIRCVHDAGGPFDVIVVDGRHRFACAREAVAALAPGGMILLDNSDWYPRTAAMLRAADLIEVDLAGFGPINDYTWTTSLFLQRSFSPRPKSGRQPMPSIGASVQSAEDDEYDTQSPCLRISEGFTTRRSSSVWPRFDCVCTGWLVR